jgi:GNAT superfamily N-acetyltransferase
VISQMSQLIPAGLRPALEHNLAVHASWLHRSTPGMSVRRSGGVLVADSGLDDDTFNFVGGAALTAENAPGRIREVLADVTATGRSFAWRVGPASAPRGLAVLLTEAGLPPAEAEPAMWMSPDAADGAVTATAGAGLEIRLVRTSAELRDWAWVLAANWDPPSATVLEFYERTASRLLTPGGPARLLVGYHHGRPACTAEVVVHAGTAGLYNISTLASQQRRGFGTAISAAALRLAADSGAHAAVLTASEQGEPVYRRLGFSVFGSLTEHPMPQLRQPTRLAGRPNAELTRPDQAGVDHDVGEVAAGLGGEYSAAGDELQSAVAVRAIDEPGREMLLRIHRDLADDEKRDHAVSKRHLDLVPWPQGPQLEEDCRAPVGVHMTKDDRRTRLTG